MDEHPADRLRQSWVDNAAAWTEAIRAGTIPSRQAGTDAAIVEALLSGLPPAGRVLDIGCGEGWLARALSALGAEVHGIDASGPLIEAARQAGGASFDLLGYADAAADPGRLGGPYDAAVFNFSLLSDDVVGVLRAAARQLDVGGRVLVQTVHPLAADLPYNDGWRMERFVGFEPALMPMPWYFRTFGSWVRTLDVAGLRIAEAHEPPHTETGVPLSLLLVAEPLAEILIPDEPV